MYKLGSVVVVGQLLTNTLYSSVCLYVSHYNYPGGRGMQELHRLLPAEAGWNDFYFHEQQTSQTLRLSVLHELL